MHPQAREYVAAALLAHADPRPKQVVEFGSYDVNGTVRDLLTDATYLGIDTRPGKGVDQVIDAADFDGKGGYDLVVSTETLEHAPKPKAVIDSAHTALAPGGLFIATMAGPHRAPHGVDGREVGSGEHYANIAPDDLREWLGDGWEILDLQYWPERGDLYVTARKLADQFIGVAYPHEAKGKRVPGKKK